MRRMDGWMDGRRKGRSRDERGGGCGGRKPVVFMGRGGDRLATKALFLPIFTANVVVRFGSVRVVGVAAAASGTNLLFAG